MYSIGGEGLSGITQVTFNSFPSAISVQPLAGGNQYFEEFGTSETQPVEFTEYCPQVRNTIALSFFFSNAKIKKLYLLTPSRSQILLAHQVTLVHPFLV